MVEGKGEAGNSYMAGEGGREQGGRCYTLLNNQISCELRVRFHFSLREWPNTQSDYSQRKCSIHLKITKRV